MRCTHERNAVTQKTSTVFNSDKMLPPCESLAVFALLRRAASASKTAIRDPCKSKNLRYGRASQLITCTGPSARVCTLCSTSPNTESSKNSEEGVPW